MASRIGKFLGRLGRRAVPFAQVVKKPCTSLSVLLVYASADDSSPNSRQTTPFKLLDRQEMSHKALIRQACSLTTNSSSQLLTQVLIAINETSQDYRKAVSDLIVLMEQSLLLLTNSSSPALDEVEDMIVEQRSLVEEQRLLLLELVSLMDYVEKTVTSAAETAYLAGAEQSSTLMCERLNSALMKVEEECAANKKSEEELLRLQQTYVIQLAELYEKEWKSDDHKEPEEKSERIPIDIFETSPSYEEPEQRNEPQFNL